MLARLARVQVAAAEPALAAARYAALLGAESPAGREGGSEGRGAGARRFRLENVTLELVELGRGGAAGGAEEGLAGLVFAAADLERFGEAARAAGLGPVPAEGPPEALALDRAVTRGVPIRVEGAPDAGPREAACAPPRTAGAVRALDHVVIRTGDAEASRRLYQEALGLRLALDRAFPDWGVRLLFFRLGGLTLELAASLRESGDPAGADRLWGLSWRVDDVPAARERLSRAGRDVSELRAGRKPGTRVFSVRDGTCGVPTLFIGPDEA